MKNTTTTFYVLRHRNGCYLVAACGVVGGEDGFGDLHTRLEAVGMDASAAWRAPGARHAAWVARFPASRYETGPDHPTHAFLAADLEVEKVTVLVDCEKQTKQCRTEKDSPEEPRCSQPLCPHPGDRQDTTHWRISMLSKKQKNRKPAKNQANGQAAVL